MSVDFYACKCCEESRYEEYIHECPHCGRNICEDCFNKDVETPERIGNKEDLTEEQYSYLCKKYGKTLIDTQVIKWGELNPEYCPFCNGDEIHNDDLLYFALSKLNMSQEQLKEEYLKSK